ncbi:hypothetical protein CALCODRAFT_101161 [Calocera cornea HHB12733]|uniref:Uncharacterized protein n=1 Tax=Calocera cornea HHB12733 TaxID=1353952 RepID=A0A165D6G3_9BASI|nr:hypothetical protein CALCODRAFT_101161 [Calocera cornea HHB12733]
MAQANSCARAGTWVRWESAIRSRQALFYYFLGLGGRALDGGAPGGLALQSWHRRARTGELWTGREALETYANLQLLRTDSLPTGPWVLVSEADIHEALGLLYMRLSKLQEAQQAFEAEAAEFRSRQNDAAVIDSEWIEEEARECEDKLGSQGADEEVARRSPCRRLYGRSSGHDLLTLLVDLF